MQWDGVRAQSLPRNRSMIGGALGHVGDIRGRKNRRDPTRARSALRARRNLVDRRDFVCRDRWKPHGDSIPDVGTSYPGVRPRDP
jgi:hypothetical protein